MSIETWITLSALVVAVLSLVAATAISVAGLSDAGRARLSKWTKSAASRAGRMLQVGIHLVIIVNGCVGIAVFAFDTAPLTRIEVLKPLLFLSNIGFGMWKLNQIADQRLAKRAELEQLLSK